MSVPLPVVDMSVYAVGQSGLVTLDKAKLTQPSHITKADEKAHLRVFNDSGSHLQVWMDTGDLNEWLPAGGWLTWDIDQTANEFHWTVVNILPNAPVQLLFITYYKQGEQPPEVPTLGNSPIGGAVQATGGAGLVTADHLINTGNAASASPIIQIAESGSTGNQLFADNQGNLIDSQYVGGVLTTLFRVIAAASNATDNVLISDALHVAHVLGLLTVDKSTYFAGATNSGAAQGGAVIAHDVSGFGSGGSTGFRTDPGASDTNWTSFWANHTAAGAGHPQNSSGFRFSGDANTAFQPDINPFGSVNGSVSGNISLYCPIWGTGLKLGILWCNGINTASLVRISFPTAFSLGLLIWVNDIINLQVGMYIGTTAQSIRHLLTVGTAGANGTTEGVTVLKWNNFGNCIANCDSIGVPTTGGAGAGFGTTLILGI